MREYWATFRQLPLKRQLIISLASSVIVLTLGLTGLVFSHMALPFETTASNNVPKAQPALSVPKSSQVSGTPSYLNIPSLNINIPVIKGQEYANGTWTLTITSAQYATITSPANNFSGNTFIYAHYRAGLFMNLHEIHPNSLAYVTTANGYKFTYKYMFTYALNPTNTTILAYKGAPILTLQTCSGAQFQNRQMFQFAYLGYQKI